MYNLKYLESLKYTFRLLFLILILISFIPCAVKSDNNQENLSEINLNALTKKTQYLKKTSSEKIFELTDALIKNAKIKTYIFYSKNICDTEGYSGKPLELLIFLESNCKIKNLKLIKHSEPILLTGIPIEKLLEGLSFYKNKDINKNLNIGENSYGEISIPIITGATVTSLRLHNTILESCRNVGTLLKFIDDDMISYGGLNDTFKEFSWNDLIKIGAIKHYILKDTLTEKLLIDMYFADLKHESIGKNILGDQYYDIFDYLPKDSSAIIVINNGKWSFKGSAFVRGGSYDRIEIQQNKNTFYFNEDTFIELYNKDFIETDSKECGIFIINNNKYKPCLPWDLILRINRISFPITYVIPKEFCKQDSSELVTLWHDNIFYIILFMNLWFLVIIIFSIRNFLAKKKFYLSIIYNFILLMDIYIIGILLKAQPSVVNIFTLIDNIKNIKTFLFSPYIFLGWIMIISTIFIWGKSLFCGWICPFGSLQELAFKIKSLIFNDNSFKLPYYEKLRLIKYIILLILIFISFDNLNKAEYAAEIEPFKTIWLRELTKTSTYIIIYPFLLIIINIFIYRFFCRFICPLGAFLSILSSFILLKLRRRGTCQVCHICEVNCTSNAIDKKGKINQKECFGCFNCINTMYNKDVCPPYKKKSLRDKYEKNVIWW